MSREHWIVRSFCDLEELESEAITDDIPEIEIEPSWSPSFKAEIEAVFQTPEAIEREFLERCRVERLTKDAHVVEYGDKWVLFED